MADIRRSEKLPKPDKRGRIRCFVGYTPGPKRAIFQVGDRGTSEAETRKRLETIRNLYAGQCEMKGCPDVWREWARQVAIRIGRGDKITESSLPEFFDDSTRSQLVERLKAWGVPVEVEDKKRHAEGMKVTHDELARMVQQAVKQEISKLAEWRGPAIDLISKGLPDDPVDLADPATLHEAIDAYCEHLKSNANRDADGNLSTFTNKCLDRLRYLKEAHEDRVLATQLDLPALEQITSHWRNRPTTQKGERCGREHVRDMLKELWRFLRWLDKQPNYRWTIPKGARDIDRTPIELPQDNKLGVFQTTPKVTYSPEQLSQILECADDFGKVLISLCVNCAFGASEVGQWHTSKFALNLAHPHAEKIGLDNTSTEDSWIVGNRPKTGVYGEHLLWGRVAEKLKPFLDGRDVLPLTSTGAPWYRTHSKNPQSKFNRWWMSLIKRTQKAHPELPYLPFGSLRDTLPDVLRNRFSDDVASLALQHGSLGEDKLLKCYANLPFRRLFEATRELEVYFEPMLKAL